MLEHEQDIQDEIMRLRDELSQARGVFSGGKKRKIEV